MYYGIQTTTTIPYIDSTTVMSDIIIYNYIFLSCVAPNGGGPKGLSAGAIAAMVVCSLVFMALGN